VNGACEPCKHARCPEAQMRNASFPTAHAQLATFLKSEAVDSQASFSVQGGCEAAAIKERPVSLDVQLLPNQPFEQNANPPQAHAPDNRQSKGDNPRNDGPLVRPHIVELTFSSQCGQHQAAQAFEVVTTKPHTSSKARRSPKEAEAV
jgi:hypothetical protein